MGRRCTSNQADTTMKGRDPGRPVTLGAGYPERANSYRRDGWGEITPRSLMTRLLGRPAGAARSISTLMPGPCWAMYFTGIRGEPGGPRH